MKAKRANAFLALLGMALLLVHLVYEIVSYKLFFYDPTVTKAIAFSFAGCVLAHVLLSLYIVFFQHEARGIKAYRKHNRRTMWQRISAIGLLVLFPVHAKASDLIMQHLVGAGVMKLLLGAQILFWILLCVHVSTGFSGALITLGYLSDLSRKKKIDRIVAAICIVLLVFSAYIVTRTQLFLGSM